ESEWRLMATPGATCTLAETSASRLATMGNTQVKKVEIMFGSLLDRDHKAPGRVNQVGGLATRSPMERGSSEDPENDLVPGFPIVRSGDATVGPGPLDLLVGERDLQLVVVGAAIGAIHGVLLDVRDVRVGQQHP